MTSPDDVSGGAPRARQSGELRPAGTTPAFMTASTARRLYFAALAAWLAAWALPSFDPGVRGQEILYGWHCFWLTMGVSPYVLVEGKPASVFQALSPWTNFLVPVSILALDRRRPGRLRRSLPWLFAVAGALGLVWMIDRDPTSRLLPGYFLWLAGFLFLAGATLGVLHSQDPAARSLLAPRRSDAAGWSLLSAAAVVAMLLLLVPLGVAIAEGIGN